MINKVLLKGIITFKEPIRLINDKPVISFGLSYNSLSKIKHIHSIICHTIGRTAQIVDENLSVKDTVIIIGFLTTMEKDLKQTIILNVESLEPTITSKNIYFRDMGVDTEVFDKYIDGFDVNK